MVPARRARAQRRAGAARPRRAQRGGGPARGGGPWLVGRLPVPQRARLRRRGGVRVRLPVRGKAAHRRDLRAQGLGGGRDDVHRHARAGHRRTRRRGPGRGGAHARRRAAAGGVRARRRGRGRDPHPAAPAPRRPRHRVGLAGPQPLDPPVRGGQGDLRGAHRDVARRAPVLLLRRVRGRGLRARGGRRAAGLHRRLDPALGARAPGADGALPAHEPVRDHDLRRGARARARSRRPTADHLRPRPARRARAPARHRGAVRDLLGGGRARGDRPARAGPDPARRRDAPVRPRPAARRRAHAHGLPPARHRARGGRSGRLGGGRARARARRGRRARARRGDGALGARGQPADHDHGPGHAGRVRLLGAPAPDEPAPERMAVPRPATPVVA